MNLKTEDIRLLYVDLFCGAGGTSSGVENARIEGKQCAKVIACINHDKNAIASHSANHPGVLHFTEDIRTLDLTKLIAHVKLMRTIYPNALLELGGSLECTNFSKAKGGQPRDGDSRTLADHFFRYIEAIDPDYIHIENVEEFMCWGDIDKDGKPVSKDKGRLYLQWIDRVKYGYGKHADRMHHDDYDNWFSTMRKIGSMEKRYNFDYSILNAANFGAYTSRKRLFLQFAKPGLPISWPEPTHCKGGSTGLFTFKKWKPVKDVLDFTDEGVSIFTRKKDLSEKTLERVYAGLIKFVAGGKDKFLTKYYSGNPSSMVVDTESPSPTIRTKDCISIVRAEFLSSYYGNGDNCSSIENPCPTVTTKDRIAIVSPKYLCSYNYKDEPRDLNTPCPTLTTKDRFALVSPCFIDQQFGQSKPSSINQPCGALTSNPKYNLVTVNPWIMNTNFNNIGSSIEDPAQTITANHKYHYLMNPQFGNQVKSVDDPCFTLIAKMDKAPPYLIVAENGERKILVNESDSEFTLKIKQFMLIYGIVDIKMRMLKIPELKMIMGFPKDYTLIGTQAEQKKQIGNAVEVTMATVLCVATVIKLKEQTKIAV
jgi:DNA (cytosine-5)-methyltransferase 1